ncbi:Hint domain-containing protein [Shimia isoporae]|uniref:Hint domain-containing protein n=1 Tax=Shimia isoporae TaxID=647720 RepID=A0A4R1N397_9RHOB|nr:Hint domain-containing protein [Shimia isoporae]TCK99961.1 Hint domain-containing protein [Shimia isoporae]
MTDSLGHSTQATAFRAGSELPVAFGESVRTTMVPSLRRPEVGTCSKTSVPCFVAGTQIVTQKGMVAIETLSPGDRVLTRDNGYQELQWIGRSGRLATGKDAPVEIAAGVLGNHDAISFSRNHRVLLQSDAATTLFGEREVLIRAGDLVNGTSVKLRDDGLPVTYVHLLFDRHEIVRANGLDCESYHPSHETLDMFDADTRQEILSHMPNTDRFMGYGYGPVARVSLREQEARALLHAA